MKILSTLLVLMLSCSQAFAQNNAPLTSNTPTGEEPSVIAKRNGDAAFKKSMETGDLKDIWSTYRLNSDSTSPERLQLPMDRTSGLQVRLDPKNGTLNFEKANFHQVFTVANAAGDSTSLCPKYSVKIKDASGDHALIRKDCQLYEFAPKKFYKSVEYYIYDLPTKTMRQIWQGVGDDTTPFPQPSPEPQLKKSANGYALDWIASNPADKGNKIHVDTRYVRLSDAKTQEQRLECTDVNASKEEMHGGACEGLAIRATQ